MVLKLINVTRSTLEELRLDSEDFLHQHRLAKWGSTEPLRQNLNDRSCSTADEVAAQVHEVHERNDNEGSGIAGKMDKVDWEHRQIGPLGLHSLLCPLHPLD